MGSSRPYELPDFKTSDSLSGALKMARVLSENTYQRMMTSIGTTEGLAGPSRAPSVRRVRSVGGGGSVRSYVKITAVTDPENYTGDILNGPDDETIKETGVSIKVKGATANAYIVGYTAFADKSGDVYYLDGFLLG
jgi:hypothetical protein